MKHLSTDLSPIRDRLPGGAQQLANLGSVARFFAALLVLTLVARGTSGAAMPKVSTAAPASATLSASFDAAGTVAVQPGKPLQLPAGLLVTEVCVAEGAQVAAGAPLARVDTDQLALAVQKLQAELAQMQVSYTQGMAPAEADDYSVRQSQARLLDAYADTEAVWARGEAAVQKAQDELDAARAALAAARANPPQPPAATSETAAAQSTDVPDPQAAYEKAKAEYDSRVAAAKSEVAAAEAALAAAKESAEEANDSALSMAESAERERDASLHSYERELESAQKAAAVSRAAAGVTAAGMAARQAELDRLLDLQRDGGAVLAPYSGTVTALALVPGADTPAVGGLLAGLDTDCVLTFTLPKAEAELAKPGMAVTVRQGSRSLDTTILTLAPADETGAVQATVLLPADGGWQAGGATARLRADLGAFGSCLPAAAVRSDGSGSFVYKVEAQDTVLGRRNVLVRIPVNVEASGDDMVAVSGALAGSDAVVVSADRPISAGARVRPE